MNILLQWVVSAVAIGITSYLLSSSTVTVTGAFVAAIVLGFLNAFIKPILFILTLPITVLTLGIFSLVLNALLVLAASALVPGFDVGGFWSALLFAILLTIINWIFFAWTRD